jgi:hypothetical protein
MIEPGIRVIHGPDRSPIGTATGPGGPFHGIASRGLLSLIGEDRELALEWPRVAYRLDEASAVWRDAVMRYHVLSYSQSAQCAKSFLVDHGAGLVGDNPLHWELWSIKEGHTASVWCATAMLGRGRAPRRFCLNVARDSVASEELLSTVQTLHALAQRDPEGVVEILATKYVRMHAGVGHWDIPVVATSWVDGWELHALPATSTTARLVAVARFLCSETEPSIITRLAGFDPGSARIWERILVHWIRLGDWGAVDGPVVLPVFEINEGDWMLSGDVVLCAVSVGTRSLDPSLAVWACILLQARGGASGAPLYWGDVERATKVLRESQGVDRLALRAGLTLAPAVPFHTLRKAGLVTDETSQALWANARRCLAKTNAGD